MRELVFGICAAAVVGILLGLVIFFDSLIRGLGVNPNLISPATYHGEQLRAIPVRVGKFAPDVAWPSYFKRQVNADLAEVRDEWQAAYRKVWEWPTDTFFHSKHGSSLGWWIFFPIPVLTITTLSVAGATVLVCFVLFAGVVYLCTMLGRIVLVLTVGTLRAIEMALGRLRGAEASCPKCYYLSQWPAYLCPGCSMLHRDIRPGTLGVFARRCNCGTLMPTMVLRAAWRLNAVCQRCEEPLRQGAAAVRDIRIPVFGDISAGKTRYLYAALESLLYTGVRNGIEITFPDDDSHKQAQRALELIRSSRDTVKTSDTLPRAFSCRIGTGATGTLLHLFDAAGERYRDASAHNDMGFLETGQGLIYILDPFAIGAVRDRLTGHSAAALSLAHAAAGDPESAYGAVVSRLRSGGIEPKSQRLAVVISKADLLTGCGLGAPSQSAQVAQWLYDSGLHNLVLAAKQEFAEVRYFTVASLSTLETTPQTDPGAPLRWLLRMRGVRLPEEPSTILAGEVS